MAGSTPSDRVVAVLAESQGSGVLLTPALVLTSSHILGDGQPPQVAHPDHPGTIPCEVLWAGDERICDAALLATVPVLPSLRRLRWGRLEGQDPLRHCQTIGFPAHQRYDGAALDLGQYTGSIMPVTGKLRGTLAFWLDQTPGIRIPGPDEPSPLAGLSGAPVFAGAVLVGIVAGVAVGEEHRQLVVTPVEAVHQQLTRRSTDLRYVDHLSDSVYSADLYPRRAPDLPFGHLPPLEKVIGFDPEDARFEERYAKALKAQYRKTEIFGIDELGISEASWDLDTAYLSLEASAWGSRVDPWDSHQGYGMEAEAEPGPRRVETLLAARRRTLLRGEAGAGKTTLVWWLASHAACGTLAPELDDLNGLVPFVVPLRNLRASSFGFPTPDELPRIARLPLGQAPHNWAERVLEAGRALLLVDGLDELPDAVRDKARSWLVSLLSRYPDTRCLATVRPGAVEAR